MRNDLLNKSLFLKQIRSFFEQRSCIEVVTASLADTTVLDPFIDSFACKGKNIEGYLQTSPEFKMKELLSLNSGDIFQITHAFRDDAVTPWHRKEFMMLEWYRNNFTSGLLIDEVLELFQLFYKADVTVVNVVSYLSSLGLDLSRYDLYCDYANALGWSSAESPVEAMDFLLQLCVRNHSAINNYIVYKDFPAILSSHSYSENDISSDRFEIYYSSLELANGCREENDFDRLSKRLLGYSNYNKSDFKIDENFIYHSSKLGCVSGVAVGLDRLYSLSVNSQSLEPLVFAAFF